MKLPIVFFDTDVLLDVLIRSDQFPDSARVLANVELGNMIGCTSPVVLTNAYYVLCRVQGRAVGLKALRKLRALLSVVEIDQQIFDQALASDLKDFEDAVQFYAAVQHRADFLVTRNCADYKQVKMGNHSVQIRTPTELRATLLPRRPGVDQGNTRVIGVAK
jgi:predicted nucleic acid-binding protein